MPNRSNRRLIARVLLGLMLLAQAAMAWSACDFATRSPERALRAPAETMPCHDAGRHAACLAHCQSERQVVQKVNFAVAAMPSAPVLVLELPVIAESDPGVSAIPAAGPITGPPRRILLQSFQI